jgi:hypothetical protein
MPSHDSRKLGALLCEPTLMVEAMLAVIRRMGIPEDHLRSDFSRDTKSASGRVETGICNAGDGSGRNEKGTIRCLFNYDGLKQWLFRHPILTHTKGKFQLKDLREFFKPKSDY